MIHSAGEPSQHHHLLLLVQNEIKVLTLYCVCTYRNKFIQVAFNIELLWNQSLNFRSSFVKWFKFFNCCDIWCSIVVLPLLLDFFSRRCMAILTECVWVRNPPHTSYTCRIVHFHVKHKTHKKWIFQWKNTEYFLFILVQLLLTHWKELNKICNRMKRNVLVLFHWKINYLFGVEVAINEVFDVCIPCMLIQMALIRQRLHGFNLYGVI